MGAGSLQDRAAKRRICPCIKVDLTVQPGKDSVLIACKRKGSFHGMALGMEIDRLLPGKHDFDRPVHLQRCQRRDMLGGNILFSAESASHQLVFNHNPIRIPSQHNGNLVPGIIDSLIRRVNLDAVLIGERHRTLRLEKCMFRKRRAVFLCHYIFRFRDSFLRISPCDMPALAEISL